MRRQVIILMISALISAVTFAVTMTFVHRWATAVRSVYPASHVLTPIVREQP
jgi:hypothetical protein